MIHKLEAAFFYCCHRFLSALISKIKIRGTRLAHTLDIFLICQSVILEHIPHHNFLDDFLKNNTKLTMQHHKTMANQYKVIWLKTD